MGILMVGGERDGENGGLLRPWRIQALEKFFGWSRGEVPRCRCPSLKPASEGIQIFGQL